MNLTDLEHRAEMAIEEMMNVSGLLLYECSVQRSGDRICPNGYNPEAVKAYRNYIATIRRFVKSQEENGRYFDEIGD